MRPTVSTRASRRQARAFRRIAAAPALAAPVALPTLALAFAACAVPGSVTLTAGPLDVRVDAAALGLPAALREDGPSGPTLRAIPCGGAAPACPDGGADVTLECAAGVCDPAPLTLAVPVGDVIDLRALPGDLSGVLSRLDRVTLQRIAVAVRANTLNVPLGEVEVFWAPEGSDDVLSDRRVAVLPPLPAGAVMAGEPAIDAVGNETLSAHLVGTSTRFRLLARTRLDFAPGGQFPTGALALDVVVTAKAEGAVGD
jgi:hypothetical protein